MARVIYVRVTTDEHDRIVDAMHNAHARSLQAFAADAILEATERWTFRPPPIAEAALEPPAES